VSDEGDGANERAEEPPEEQPAPRAGIAADAPNPRKALPFLIVPIIAMVAMNYIGNAIGPSLVVEKPALLLALNSTNKWLFLAGNQLDLLPYYLIGTLRLLAPDPLFYLIGYWYGDAALRWIERKSPTYGVGIRQLEHGFEKASWLFVITIPNNPVCLLAGAARMRPIVFAVLNVVGTVGRLFLIRWLGDIFSGPVDWLLGKIAEYRIPLTVISIGIVAIIVFRDWRAGTGQIDQLRELGDEIEDEYDAEQDAERDGTP